MHLSQLHYLPLPLPFFSILVGALVFLFIFIQVGILRYAYMRIGISSVGALFLLLGSLVGSYFNIPIAQLPDQKVVSGQVIAYFGMHYVVPTVVDWPGTVIAVNVGGALIPTFVSLYLILKNALWIPSLVSVACVAAICHVFAQPEPGLGIALPVFVPALAAAAVPLLFYRRVAAPLAYISGSLGTLIGADLLNLGKVEGLGAPVASIGGAGTFDGIFLAGVLAVLLASLLPHSAKPAENEPPPEGPSQPSSEDPSQ
jgi:uncharacterized membrane protein